MYHYIEYLPVYLREIRELKALGQCADPPMEALEQRIKTIYADRFVGAAGVETVARLEAVYNLPHRADLPLSTRRRQLLAKMAASQDLTKKYMEELAQTVTGVKSRVDIDFDIPKMDVVLVQDSLTPPAVALLAKTIDEQKPANMLYSITVEQPLSGVIYVGAALLDGEILTIRQVV